MDSKHNDMIMADPFNKIRVLQCMSYVTCHECDMILLLATYSYFYTLRESYSVFTLEQLVLLSL